MEFLKPYLVGLFYLVVCPGTMVRHGLTATKNTTAQNEHKKLMIFLVHFVFPLCICDQKDPGADMANINRLYSKTFSKKLHSGR